ncbi:MAG TPA: hypothetical protein VHO90_11415, partial [Bacteroidales bacterium]|nr:hypothetical protein [Bacteroidales bacterium]
MFEDDDDDDEDSVDNEFYDWRNTYEFWFPKELVYGPDYIIRDFYQAKYPGLIADLIRETKELIYMHYPEIETELRPRIVKIIENRLEDICIKITIDLFSLLHYEFNGFNLKEKYPKIDEWTRLYSRPPISFKNMDDTFDKLNLTRQQRRVIMEELESDDNFMVRKERRRAQLIHVVQKIAFRHYPNLENLSTDGWVVFSEFMHEAFFEYKFHFDYLASFIYYNLPEEDIGLTYGELQ